MADPHIDAVARILAAHELYDWVTLPTTDPKSLRDRTVFRQIAAEILSTLRGEGS